MSNLETRQFEENLELALAGLDKLDISTSNYHDFKNQSDEILRIFFSNYKSNDDSQIEISLKCLKLLKQSCAMGESFQNELMSKENLLGKLKLILPDESVQENIRINCLQLAANLCVQNKPNQEMVLKELKEFLLQSIQCNSRFANASTMLVYNSFITKAEHSLDAQESLEILLLNVEKARLTQNDLPEFVSIFMEYLICKTAEILEGYEKIDVERRLQFLRYLIEYIRMDDRQSPPINKELFHHLMIDFNKKCDVLLNAKTCIDLDNSEELFTLLMLLSDATCVYPYGQFLQLYKTVFLNMGYLLRQLHELGKSENVNMFTPVQKIEEILKTKQGKSQIKIEEDISFSLKSSLVKALANLLYQNKTNQDLARETGLIQIILECTNLDARNPQWTILTIRNLCEENVENQKFIASLSKIGDADNTIVTDYTSGGGTIRITSRSSQK
ncbi:ataxin-10 isoform X2 [Malaya genurostris]|uniref:ataxin-10 isoform X2 n=1 Tax=Malaya genurostris TaxID=325434 RepID=UPI0026F3A690|nr:ataxin-10 isoform X2 [Malaya genurostris]